MSLRLVARIGDGDDYHYYEDFDELADAFAEKGIGQIWHNDKWSVAAGGFRPQNHISLYWAEEIETPLHPITKDEIQEINETLERCKK